MIAERILKKLLAFLLVLTFIVQSCQKEEEKPEYSYYVSSELLTSYSLSYIHNLLSIAGEYIPEDYDLMPLINSAVDVYKIVYETTIDGEKLNVSGIVCVPGEPGDYPVLSFQNGTNTLNSNAPSIDFFEPAYQLVEIIASMGYVVVMADYPGFGESSQIPHPYLIATPTVTSITDLFYAVREMDELLLPDVSIGNEYYLLGYSQGGWATMQLHKALELEYDQHFNLMGSTCGAGPYNIRQLMQTIMSQSTFPQPYYLGYVANAYIAYEQFTNPVTDLFNEPYAGRIGSLYTGLLSGGQINAQLTESIADLVNADFLTGFATATKYSSIRDAMDANSIEPWHTNKPLLMIHGDADTDVDVSATINMHEAMIGAGTSPDVCKMEIIPDADHGGGLIPAMIQGLFFLNDIRNSN